MTTGQKSRGCTVALWAIAIIAAAMLVVGLAGLAACDSMPALCNAITSLIGVNS